MCKALLAFTLLAGMAGMAAAPADAAPSAHGLTPAALAATLPATNPSSPVVTEGAAVENIQYYRRRYARRYSNRRYYRRY